MVFLLLLCSEKGDQLRFTKWSEVITSGTSIESLGWPKCLLDLDMELFLIGNLVFV